MPKCPAPSAIAAAILLVASPAMAQDVTKDLPRDEPPVVVVHVENLRSAAGSVMVAVCTAEDFLGAHCRHHARTRARLGAADVAVGGVPPGRYAVQAIHDENDNSELDRNLIGMPREGFGFSRDAPMRLGPPRFSDAAVEIGEGGGSVTLSMRYF
jgi:uncharacterized protein (DUF2141 family)